MVRGGAGCEVWRYDDLSGRERGGKPEVSAGRGEFSRRGQGSVLVRRNTQKLFKRRDEETGSGGIRSWGNGTAARRESSAAGAAGPTRSSGRRRRGARPAGSGRTGDRTVVRQPGSHAGVQRAGCGGDRDA